MDVLKFNNPNHPLNMEQASIVEGIKSKMWIERYGPAGEFKFTVPATLEMKNKLPIGSFVSHTQTAELMLIENHEIAEVEGKDSDLIVTGRGFECIFENRIVGANKTFPTSGEVPEYPIAAGHIWDQIINLIKDHIFASQLIDDGDAFPYIDFFTDLFGIPEDEVARSVKRATLYDAVQALLAVDNLGIKVLRPGVWSPLAPTTSTVLQIHKGVDRTKSIVFSEDTGEMQGAEYLWSSKKDKNAVLITGRWVETSVVPALTEIFRKWTFIDASDIDSQFTDAPTGTDLANVVASMQQRGREVLAAQKEIAITKIEVSKESNRAHYRQDFDLGDLIMVHGSYNESATMRITEYVEIEDDTGTQMYPTLELI